MELKEWEHLPLPLVTLLSVGVLEVDSFFVVSTDEPSLRIGFKGPQLLLSEERQSWAAVDSRSSQIYTEEMQLNRKRINEQFYTDHLLANNKSLEENMLGWI